MNKSLYNKKLKKPTIKIDNIVITVPTCLEYSNLNEVIGKVNASIFKKKPLTFMDA